MRKENVWVWAATVFCSIVMVSCANKSGDISAEDDSEFVMLTDAVPDAILEIRYYGTYNFVGSRIDGYEEPTALLTKQAADSLKAVSDDVIKLGYRLKIMMRIVRRKGLTTSCVGQRIFLIR